ncbi:response regulator transcription factor [Sutcliffiella horikoshii]|uniref:response regulator transcription factor n=1 Tax=Sutcliffiella horikoshii TaxID=79883 RepID=UPI001F16E56B|nr:response regulator transcription factor [Sutcliffiella horikoshii]MCG1022897.1 response regulator transcription factor [Sutcliffiella horikoshii]
MHKIMLIEDDRQLSELVGNHLERYGYTIYKPNDFQHIMDSLLDVQPDLVLLDINLPYYDGYFLCRSIRQQSTVPIIIISARSTEMDQIMAMELGADDYITKPFTFDLLHAKVKATIRRVYGEYASADTGELSIEGLSLDSQTLAVQFKGNRQELSKNEYILLKKLMEEHNTYIPREALIETVWDSLTFVDDNTLTVNMTRIKQKLSSLGLPKVITSKRGVGYMLSVPSPIGKTNE